ncbi:hypothetical protein [Reichenbachiella versicolor]|uniref:hypothetical protein n=1 Tax=Reichenbachiella versicolor TaxID=1821036 RepID=UPI000D6DE954|nr:hypothetical protein [Reichenbachiella versicolor]
MRLYISFIILFLFSTSTFSQLRIDKAIPPSFDAAAIIKYCDHPTGIKYGIPKIQFPMRTLIDQDLYVPIKLNYHPLGIKVEEEATWVGLGWYLQAGGMITRIVRGENDFALCDFPDENKSKGYPFEHIKPCFDDCEENENDEFHKSVCAGEIDSDPDIFFFDILGTKGKFLLTPDHKPDAEYVEIEIVSPKKMTGKYFLKSNSWEFVDSRGYKYEFKTRSTTYNLNNYFDYKFQSHKIHFDFQEIHATNAWYLDKVTSPKGANAYFEYDDMGYKSDGAFQKMNINDADVWDVHYSSYCFPENIENVQITGQSNYQDVYLKSITLGGFRAEFTISEQKHSHPKEEIQSNDSKRHFSDIGDGLGRQKLDKISITRDGKEIQTADFKYSYFWNGDGKDLPMLYSRLKLDGLSITTGSKTRTMDFGYQEKFGLASKESHARDLWGFYNGEEDLYNITPSDYFNYSQPEKMLQEEGRSKHYSLDHIMEGVLNKVSYAGGKEVSYLYDHQEFFHIDEEISSHFEKNMAESNLDHALNPFLFGGLRIKEIQEKYPDETIYKEFDYTMDGREDGKLIITHYSHSHHGYGHKTSGNHCVKYQKVSIKSGKMHNGQKF